MGLGVSTVSARTREEKEYKEELTRQRNALYRLLEADLPSDHINMLSDLLGQVNAGYGLTRSQGLQLRSALSYYPIPGEDIPIPPGPLLICPVNGCDYRCYRRQKGDEPTCPEHGVPLVPAEP